MMKSPMMRLLFVISSWLCAIAALHLGLIGLLGRNLVEEMLMKMNLGMLFVPLHYVFGIAGVICIIMLLMEAMNPGSCVVKE